MNKFLNVIKGMVIGVSNIIPGVSGGTMAVVFGIYDKLISSITNFFTDWKKNFSFLFQIALGAGLGIILFSKLLTYLLDSFPEQTNFFFIGLIIGSVPILFKKATAKKVQPINIIWLVVTFGLLVWMAFSGEAESSKVILTTLNVKSFVSLVLAGFIAAATMILPGVSGSFVLLLLGLYDTMLAAVSNFNIPLLFACGIGAVLGLVTMTKVIETIFNKFPQTAYMAILGLILGSIFAIFPGFTLGASGIVSIIACIGGFLIAYIVGKNE